MMDLKTALAYLTKVIEKKLEHKDYKRTIELSAKYTALITGEGIDAYLRQFTRRESLEMFEQRKKLTQAITPAVCESIMNPFYKVSRTNRVIQEIGVGNKQKQEILDAIKGFWGEGEQSGLDYFMQTRWIELVFSDPNAFLAIEFDPFDPDKTKAQPKPVEISSEQAIDYSYDNGVLQYLIGRWLHQYDDGKGNMKDGERYVMYLEDDAIELIEVDLKTLTTDIPNPEFITLANNTRAFVIQYYQPKSGQVPALRVGYKRDLFTGGRTYVSPLHPALSYFMKSIKAVSELDLTMALHAFPQKFQYVTPCKGSSGLGCKDGSTRDGKVCQQCGGSGVSAVHTTAQDVVLMPLPRTKEEFFPLEDMVAYKTPDIDLVKFQNDYIQQLKGEAIRAVFNGDTFIQSTVAKTATEKELDMDAVYDTLAPFAKRYSTIWMAVVKLIAVYTENDAKELLIFHKFPSDFKLKNLNQLLTELKLASESNAASYVVDSIHRDLMEMMYADDQDNLVKLKVKARFYPFAGKPVEHIQTILMSDTTTKYHKILYANYDEIFSMIELEKGDDFYLMAEPMQREIIKAKVDELDKQITAQAPKLPALGGAQLPAPGSPGDQT
jgi:hypothetical protein